MKRLLDTAVSLAALLWLWPLLLVLALLIRRDSKGPALFVQERAGQGGKPFRFYKFRTMRTEVDPYGPSPKGGEDPRLTKIGRFLRETSLDELPQLLNVLKGDMSLVGPRPLYMSQISEWNEVQKQRLLVKPGLTGLAQTQGRGALTREEKLALDVQYVQHHSLIMDLRLCLRTVVQLCGRRDVYEKRYAQDQETRHVSPE